jgi:probable blue pigment (indigoidine) exporter
LWLVTALAPITWGTTYLVTTEWLPPDRPLLAATVRALPAGLLLVAMGRQLPRGDWWWRASVLGLLNIGVFFALLFVAAHRLPGGVAATLGAVQPLVVVGLSAALLSETVTRRSVLAGVTGVLGVGLLVMRASARLDTLGVLAGLLGAVSMALGVVLSKRWGRPEGVSLISYTGWLLTAGGMSLLPVTMTFEAPPAALSPTHARGVHLPGDHQHGHRLLPLGYACADAAAHKVAYLGLLTPIVATFAGAVCTGTDADLAAGTGSCAGARQRGRGSDGSTPVPAGGAGDEAPVLSLTGRWWMWPETCRRHGPIT